MVSSSAAAACSDADAQAAAQAAPLRLIQPGGPNTFAFLAGKNFDVIKTYNPSTSFAIAVSTLAAEIRLRS